MRSSVASQFCVFVLYILVCITSLFNCCIHIQFSISGWQWKQFRKLHHPSFWVCGNYCKSGSGGDLGTYSHCNLAADVNHNGIQEHYSLNGHHNGGINGIINGNHQYGLTNGVSANVHSEVKSCPYK